MDYEMDSKGKTVGSDSNEKYQSLIGCSWSPMFYQYQSYGLI